MLCNVCKLVVKCCTISNPALRLFQKISNDAFFVFFSRPDGIGTVTAEEKERFDEIKERLRILLENQITHFRLV